MSDKWYYTQKGNRIGPVSSEELQKAIALGGLLPSDFVWKQGMPNWEAACKVDGLFISPPPMPPHAASTQYSSAGYTAFDQVPWYRREPGFWMFLLAIIFTPVTIALCFICLTGDVYKNARDSAGNLIKWGKGQKIAAVVILLLQWFLIWASTGGYEKFMHRFV